MSQSRSIPVRETPAKSLYESLPVRSPALKERGQELYSACRSKGYPDYRTSTNRELLAAVLRIASRETDTPVLTEEIAEAASANVDSVYRVARIIRQEYEIIDSPISINAYVTRFGEEIGLSTDAVRLSRELTKLVKRHQLGTSMGRSPSAVAAAVIYVATQRSEQQSDTVSQQQIGAQTYTDRKQISTIANQIRVATTRD